MDLHLWLGFVVASAVMGLIPGPGVTTIVGYALSSGRKTALASVAGMALGNVLAMTLSLAGVGALLSASAFAFSVLKWAGAMYLIGLGMITLWKSRRITDQHNLSAVIISPRTAFANTIAVGLFHPKTIVFFVAFVPQFMDPKIHYLPQAILLIVTFGLVIGLTDSLYALSASYASQVLKRPKAKLWSQRLGGGVLVAAGVATAAARNR